METKALIMLFITWYKKDSLNCCWKHSSVDSYQIKPFCFIWLNVHFNFLWKTKWKPNDTWCARPT